VIKALAVGAEYFVELFLHIPAKYQRLPLFETYHLQMIDK